MSTMNFERSQLHSTQLTPIKSSRLKHLLNREDTLNMSPILNETSILKNVNDTSLRQVLGESSMIIHTGNAGDRLSEVFFEIIQASRPSEVLDTLARLARACGDSLELVEPWNRYKAQNLWLAEEANTWKLLYCLFADSVTEHPESINVSSEHTLSPQTLVNAFFQCNSEIRLLQVLVDWLEAAAAYQEETTQNSAPVICNNMNWENQLNDLLNESGLFNREKNQSLIATCMDPDVQRCQNKAIHSDDKKDDYDLCKRIFKEVRCGKFNEAISQCISAGQAWRGAVLQGWKLLHYQKGENGSIEVHGNSSRDLWKWCALGIANNVSENIHYRATIGILCGHLQSAIPACQGNWEDFLWAHLRVQIEARVDKFLHEDHTTAEDNTTPSDILELLENDPTIEELSLQQVFDAIQCLMEGKRESSYQTCQRYLILGQIRTIMQDSLQWIQNSEETFIRFLAHLVIVLRQMGKDPQHDIGDTILEKYVKQLIYGLVEVSCEHLKLIAYYTSTVPIARQIILYAELMDRIQKSEHRGEVVQAGIKAGIDVAASARVVIKKAIAEIQQGYGNVDMIFKQSTSTEKEKTLITISSLEWLSLVSKQIDEALWLRNAMIRTFISIGNTAAALHCVSSVRELFAEYVERSSENSSELREHLCLKAYLEALEGFATWYRNFISGQPKDVDSLAPNSSFSDKVYHEQKCAQVEEQKAKWKNAILHQSRHTKNLLYNVLLFPGGWLQDETDGQVSQNFNTEERDERTKHLDTLRRLCIPEVCILILKILQSGDDIEQHREAVKLCDLIADENRSLYEVFAKNKLLEILDRIKESSLLLLEKGRDIFGYELNE